MKINRKKESDGERIRLLRRIAVGKSRRIRTGSTPPECRQRPALPSPRSDVPTPPHSVERRLRAARNRHRGTVRSGETPPPTDAGRCKQVSSAPYGSAGILPYKFRSAVQNRQTAYPRPGRSASGKAPPLRLGPADAPDEKEPSAFFSALRTPQEELGIDKTSRRIGQTVRIRLANRTAGTAAGRPAISRRTVCSRRVSIRG